MIHICYFPSSILQPCVKKIANNNNNNILGPSHLWTVLTLYSWFVLSGFFWRRKLKNFTPSASSLLIYRAQLKCAGVCDAPERSLYIPTVNTVYYIIHTTVLWRDGFQCGPSEYGIL